MPSPGWQPSDDGHAVKVSVQEAGDFGARVLVGLGSPADIAEPVAGWLVGADLAGHASHGIVRLMDYADRIARGTLDPAGRAQVRPLPGRAADGPVVLVDAHKGYGHPAAALLTDELIDRAHAHGVSTGGAVNVSHTGRLGEWSERAARAGVILFLCYASLDKSNVAAYGAREARLGTNPLTIGVPAADGDALILDMATSAIAGGKIQHHIAAGTQAPPGALLDRDGMPTTDPAAFVNGGMLSTFGGHKGYGLARPSPCWQARWSDRRPTTWITVCSRSPSTRAASPRGMRSRRRSASNSTGCARRHRHPVSRPWRWPATTNGPSAQPLPEPSRYRMPSGPS